MECETGFCLPIATTTRPSRRLGTSSRLWRSPASSPTRRCCGIAIRSGTCSACRTIRARPTSTRTRPCRTTTRKTTQDRGVWQASPGDDRQSHSQEGTEEGEEMTDVILYTQPGCGPCIGLTLKLTTDGHYVREVNIREDVSSQARTAELGYTGTPVV